MFQVLGEGYTCGRAADLYQSGDEQMSAWGEDECFEAALELAYSMSDAVYPKFTPSSDNRSARVSSTDHRAMYAAFGHLAEDLVEQAEALGDIVDPSAPYPPNERRVLLPILEAVDHAAAAVHGAAAAAGPPYSWTLLDVGAGEGLATATALSAFPASARVIAVDPCHSLRPFSAVDNAQRLVKRFAGEGRLTFVCAAPSSDGREMRDALAAHPSDISHRPRSSSSIISSNRSGDEGDPSPWPAPWPEHLRTEVLRVDGTSTGSLDLGTVALVLLHAQAYAKPGAHKEVEGAKYCPLKITSEFKLRSTRQQYTVDPLRQDLILRYPISPNSS